jgi:hypothetical protein
MLPETGTPHQPESVRRPALWSTRTLLAPWVRRLARVEADLEAVGAWDELRAMNSLSNDELLLLASSIPNPEGAGPGGPTPHTNPRGAYYG